MEQLFFLWPWSSTLIFLNYIFIIFILHFYMYNRSIDICSIVFWYTSLCNYLELLDNGPRWPKYVGKKLQTIINCSLNPEWWFSFLNLFSSYYNQVFVIITYVGHGSQMCTALFTDKEDYSKCPQIISLWKNNFANGRLHHIIENVF